MCSHQGVCTKFLRCYKRRRLLSTPTQIPPTSIFYYHHQQWIAWPQSYSSIYSATFPFPHFGCAAASTALSPYLLFHTSFRIYPNGWILTNPYSFLFPLPMTHLIDLQSSGPHGQRFQIFMSKWYGYRSFGKHLRGACSPRGAAPKA